MVHEDRGEPGLEVEHYAGDDLECNSTSGSVRIGLPPGRAPNMDLNTISGDIRRDFSPDGGDGATARPRVKTISGDIALVGAAGGGVTYPGEDPLAG